MIFSTPPTAPFSPGTGTDSRVFSKSANANLTEFSQGMVPSERDWLELEVGPVPPKAGSWSLWSSVGSSCTCEPDTEADGLRTRDSISTPVDVRFLDEFLSNGEKICFSFFLAEAVGRLRKRSADMKGSGLKGNNR